MQDDAANRPDGTPEVLAVDLDGTLIRTDMLYESFWAAFVANWRTPLAALGAVRGGPAALKQRLADMAQVDPARLPYNEQVLAYIRDWKARGGQVVLVTASNQALAQAIADHLGIFDRAFGSGPRHNLKGRRKAAFLQETFGPGGYAYMGDAPADLAVWAGAGRVITVNAASGLRARAAALGHPTDHIGRTGRSLAAYGAALYPLRWILNLVMIFPLVLIWAQQGGLTPAALKGWALGLVAFSVMTSGAYVMNDLLDLASDRGHPFRRLRPFAAGRVSLAHGTIMAAVLPVLAGLIGLVLGWGFVGVLAVVWLVALAYSQGLKWRAGFDVGLVALMGAAQIPAGALAAGDTVPWGMAEWVFLGLVLVLVLRGRYARRPGVGQRAAR